jgi:TIR domain
MSIVPAGASTVGHVFLSHAGVDTKPARQFAEALRRNGIEVWFDKDHLVPGDPWMATLTVARWDG